MFLLCCSDAVSYINYPPPRNDNPDYPKLAFLLNSIKDKTHDTKLFGGSFVINSLLEKQQLDRPLTTVIDSSTGRVIYRVNQ